MDIAYGNERDTPYWELVKRAFLCSLGADMPYLLSWIWCIATAQPSPSSALGRSRASSECDFYGVCSDSDEGYYIPPTQLPCLVVQNGSLGGSIQVAVQMSEVIEF
nr:hypothetical protein [Tanacetum cinerariifolium]